MTYTYNVNTREVVMISEGVNHYDNPDWADFATDENILEEFLARPEGTALYYEDGVLVIR